MSNAAPQGSAARPARGGTSLRKSSTHRLSKVRPIPPPPPLPIATPSRRPLGFGYLLVGSVLVCVITAYGVGLRNSYVKEVEAAKSLSVPLDVSDRFDKAAPDYDSEIDTMEWLMRIKRRRRQLARQATGHVLEASVGTGRNMDYYQVGKHLRASFTFVDQSPEMINIAREKFEKLYPKYGKAVFRTQSAAEPIPTPPGGFDTIIQTMGLCSTADPVALLHNFEALTNKEHGQIFLLEHGRSHYEWLNNILDNLAPLHADKHGCWWNKDILKIVEDSGLTVTKSKRYHFGTTYWLELRPRSTQEKSGVA